MAQAINRRGQWIAAALAARQADRGHAEVTNVLLYAAVEPDWDSMLRAASKIRQAGARVRVTCGFDPRGQPKGGLDSDARGLDLVISALRQRPELSCVGHPGMHTNAHSYGKHHAAAPTMFFEYQYSRLHIGYCEFIGGELARDRGYARRLPQGRRRGPPPMRGDSTTAGLPPRSWPAVLVSQLPTSSTHLLRRICAASDISCDRIPTRR